MEEALYKMEGVVTIPEEKREEYNRKVLELLYKGGIRKTEEIMLDGNSITVVRQALPDENGIVSFDYSIFEKRERNISTFNIKTGELCITDSGNYEYGMIMDLLMVLQQAYSNTPCFYSYKSKPIHLSRYLEVLDTILGERTVCKHGTDIWEIFKYYHLNSDLKNITVQEAYEMSSWEENENKFEQVYWMIYMGDDMSGISDSAECISKENLKEASFVEKASFLYRSFKSHIEDIEMDSWLRLLLESPAEERKKKALLNDDYGNIAEASLYIPAMGLLNIYAKAKGEDFWTVWDRFKIDGYTDIPFIIGMERVFKERARVPLFIPMRRDNEDEFIEFWDGNNLKLSKGLMRRFEKWKRNYEKCKNLDNMNMESMLYRILHDLENDWKCRYADLTFVEEFLVNKTDDRYLRLLRVLQDFMYEGTEFFPELTKRQAIDWIIKSRRDKNDSIMMSSYVSLLANHSQRLRIMGV